MRLEAKRAHLHYSVPSLLLGRTRRSTAGEAAVSATPGGVSVLTLSRLLPTGATLGRGKGSLTSPAAAFSAVCGTLRVVEAAEFAVTTGAGAIATVSEAVTAVVAEAAATDRGDGGLTAPFAGSTILANLALTG